MRSPATSSTPSFAPTSLRTSRSMTGATGWSPRGTHATNAPCDGKRTAYCPMRTPGTSPCHGPRTVAGFIHGGYKRDLDHRGAGNGGQATPPLHVLWLGRAPDTFV